MAQTAALPACVGIILDGNRRWANANGLPKLEGHRRGMDKLPDCTRWMRDRGIKHLIVYALSTENLQRTHEEVSYLMDLAVEFAQRALEELGKENVRTRFIGKRELLPERVQKAISALEENSKDGSAITLWVCLAYGSHAEIVAAAQALGAAGEEITEASMSERLWTAEMPDPDLIIRPGGEKRLSNFLLWQAAYSELFFLDKMWPDFSEADLDATLAEYASRERRRGK